MNNLSRHRTWNEFAQSVTVTVGWMIGWTALLILYGTWWI